MRWAVLIVFLALAAPAGAQVAKPQTVSLDSEAPPGAPPHWLPNEQWVMQHWLPYDETRLYELTGVTRGEIWRWLRDDTRNVAGLAALHGWADPHVLARELVAPWRGKLREPHRMKLLEERALRTLTQGHLAQHIFFHSLHQDAIPDNAPEIFGTSTTRFRDLRRSELSPLMICRLNGLSRAHARAAAEQTLRDMAARGVHGQAIPASQAERLLQRQLRQVPRWLQQTRYNGPPPLKLPRGSIATASNYSNNAVLAGNGQRVAFESYEAKLALAKTKGEIGVVAGALDGSGTLLRRPGTGPASAYNPAVSADGRFVAFESAEGNFNFAKRYGQMAVWVHDTERGVAHPASASALKVPFSAYNPTISGDGHVVAYETSESAHGDLAVWVTDVRSGRARLVGKDIYEPSLSPDGRFLAFTGAGSQVFLRDLRRGTTRQVFNGGEAWEPVVSRGGRTVAFTEGRDVVVVGVYGGRISLPGATVSEPSISADGRFVAYTARGAGSDSSAVYVHDVETGQNELVSRSSAGVPAMGASARPSISADGTRVAFTSDAWNLSPEKCNPARGIFVRDLAAGTTTLVSRGDGANAGLGPTKGSGGASAMRVALMCA